MLAVFSAPDAVVIAAVLAAVGTNVANLINSHRAAKQTKPNGGSSMRDAIDRTEQATQFMATRMDHAANILAELTDRVAVLEARDPNSRSRSTDQKEPEQ